MSFQTRDFVFNGIPSETYNVYITSLGEGQSTSSGSSDVDIRTQFVFKRPVPYFYGASENVVLSFPCMITSPTELSSDTSRAISKWLFGHTSYKKLQVVQSDMLNFYYDCFLKNPSTLRVGGEIRGYEFEVVCNAPYAWEFEKTYTRTYLNPVVDDTFTFQNTSDSNGYMYPRFVVTIDGFGGDFSLVNTSDSDREFSITGLTNGEVITVDNDRGILTTDQPSILRMSNFNKKWFRLVSGRNDLELTGNVTSLVMTYDLARKVG